MPQDVTERVLAERLVALGGAVHGGVPATAIVEDGDSASVTVNSDAGESVVKARYVVGGDGMHSVVRAAAGIVFEGDVYGESFVLADLHMDWSLGDTEVSLFFSPAGLVVVAPLPNGSFRVVATLTMRPSSQRSRTFRP